MPHCEAAGTILIPGGNIHFSMQITLVTCKGMQLSTLKLHQLGPLSANHDEVSLLISTPIGSGSSSSFSSATMADLQPAPFGFDDGLYSILFDFAEELDG